MNTVTASASIDGLLKKGQNLFASSSPNKSRLETRNGELEDMLDFEREARLRAEKNIKDSNAHVNSLTERLEEYVDANSHLQDLVKRREQELGKLRKEFDASKLEYEKLDAQFRRKQQQVTSELTSTNDTLLKQKSKCEKEISQLSMELEQCMNKYSTANKEKSMAETRLDKAMDELEALQSAHQDAEKTLRDFQSTRNQLTKENAELQARVHELQLLNNAGRKHQTEMEDNLHTSRRHLDDETKMKNSLLCQLTGLQKDFECLKTELEDIRAENENLHSQASHNTESASSLRTRLEKELATKSEDYDLLKKRTTQQMDEMNDEIEAQQISLHASEKAKSKLTLELKDLRVNNENLVSEHMELTRKFKWLEKHSQELQRKKESQDSQLDKLSSEQSRMAKETTDQKEKLNHFELTNETLSQENKHLRDANRELEASSRELHTRLNDNELQLAKWEHDVGQMQKALRALESAKEEACAREAQIATTHSAYKTDMDKRHAQLQADYMKLKKTTNERVEELSGSLGEAECRVRSESGRLRKQLEASMQEHQIQLDTVSRSNAALMKENRGLSVRLKESDHQLSMQRNANETTLTKLQTSERKCLSLTSDLDELRVVHDASQKARRSLETEMSNAETRLKEQSLLITSLTNDKRKLDDDLKIMRYDIETATNEKQALHEKNQQLKTDLDNKSRLHNETIESLESQNIQQSKMQLEKADLQRRVNEVEQAAGQQFNSQLKSLRARVEQLEQESAEESSANRELSQQNRRLEKEVKDLRSRIDEYRKAADEQQHALEEHKSLLKAYKSQVEQLETQNEASMGKFRRAQSQVEEAEHRVEMAERAMTLRNYQPQPPQPHNTSPLRLRQASTGASSGLRDSLSLRPTSVLATTRSFTPSGLRR